MNWLLLLVALPSSIWSIPSPIDKEAKNGIENTGTYILEVDKEPEVENQSRLQQNTILLFHENHGLILSENRSHWIKVDLKPPYNPYGSGAVFLNGEIYLFAGKYNRLALYKLDKNLKWIRLANMNGGRDQITHSCLVWNGYIWVFGGFDGRYKGLYSVERYDPKEDKWTRMPNMKYPRADAAVAVVNDRVVISGGYGYGARTNTIECYNPETGNCTGLFYLPSSLDEHSLISYNKKLIIMGGANRESQEISDTWQFDPSNSMWKSLPPMKHPASSFGGLVLDQEIYAIGGFHNNNCLNRVEIFNGKEWRDGPPLPSQWCSMPALIVRQDLADRLVAYKP